MRLIISKSVLIHQPGTPPNKSYAPSLGSACVRCLISWFYLIYFDSSSSIALRSLAFRQCSSLAAFRGNRQSCTGQVSHCEWRLHLYRNSLCISRFFLLSHFDGITHEHKRTQILSYCTVSNRYFKTGCICLFRHSEFLKAEFFSFLYVFFEMTLLETNAKKKEKVQKTKRSNNKKKLKMRVYFQRWLVIQPRPGFRKVYKFGFSKWLRWWWANVAPCFR